MAYSTPIGRTVNCITVTMALAAILSIATEVATSQQPTDFAKSTSNPPVDGEVFLFVNTNSGRCLSVKDGKIVQGPFPAKATSTEQWKAVRVGDYFKLINQRNGTALAVPNSSKDLGRELVEWQDNGFEDQKWEFVKAGNNYSIKSRVSGFVLAVGSAVKDEHAKVIQWKWENLPDQTWHVRKIDQKSEVAKVPVKPEQEENKRQSNKSRTFSVVAPDGLGPKSLGPKSIAFISPKGDAFGAFSVQETQTKLDAKTHLTVRIGIARGNAKNPKLLKEGEFKTDTGLNVYWAVLEQDIQRLGIGQDRKIDAYFVVQGESGMVYTFDSYGMGQGRAELIPRFEKAVRSFQIDKK